MAHDKSGNGNDGTIYGATWVSEAGEVPALVNVNLSAQTVTLEVKIVASEVTVDVNVVGTVNVNITEAIVNISALKLMDEGTVMVMHASASDGALTTIYTVPTGKKAYLYYAFCMAYFIGTSGSGAAQLKVWDGTESHILMRHLVGDATPPGHEVTSFTFLRLEEGWKVELLAATGVMAYATIVVVEMPA